MTDPTWAPIRRALVSVYDKTGLEELGRALAAAGVEIVSTGSTARKLSEAGVEVVPVEQVTGFPRPWTDASRRCIPPSTPGSLPIVALSPTAANSMSWASSPSTWW